MTLETTTSWPTEAWQEQVVALVRKQIWYLRRPVLMPATHLRRDLGLELCERVQLGIRLEYGLGIKIPDTEIGQWQTLAEVLDCVHRYLPAPVARQHPALTSPPPPKHSL